MFGEQYVLYSVHYGDSTLNSKKLESKSRLKFLIQKGRLSLPVGCYRTNIDYYGRYVSDARNKAGVYFKSRCQEIFSYVF